jgi:hypothetical protein
MRRDGMDGTGHESSRHGTGWNFQRKMTRDGTGRDKRARDTGRDGTTFWSSRGALVRNIVTTVGRRLHTRKSE